MALNIPEIIDKELMKPSNWGDGDPPNLFHPSSVGYCERQMFLSKKGLKIFGRDVKGAMRVGKIIHKFLQEVIPNYVSEKVLIEHEVESKIVGEIFFRGHIDLLYDKEVYDIKSINMHNPPKEPHEGYVHQVNCYMGMVGAKQGHIIYVTKGNMRSNQITFAFNEEMYHYSMYKANKVFEAIKKWDGKIENIPFKKCSCYFCNTEKLKELE